VFFNLFAAGNLSANVWVARGTLHAMIQVSILLSMINLWNNGTPTTAQNCSCEFRPRQFRSVSAEPLTATRGNLRFRVTLVEKHWRTRLPDWLHQQRNWCSMVWKCWIETGMHICLLKAKPFGQPIAYICIWWNKQIIFSFCRRNLCLTRNDILSRSP